MTPNDGLDEIDGSEINAVRRRAIELTEHKDEDEMTDLELFARAPEEFWYIDLCVDKLHRLPSEIDPVIGCREYTALQAHALITRAMGELMQRAASAARPHLGG